MYIKYCVFGQQSVSIVSLKMLNFYYVFLLCEQEIYWYCPNDNFFWTNLLAISKDFGCAIANSMYVVKM